MAKEKKEILGVPLPETVKRDFKLLSTYYGVAPATNARILIVAYINDRKHRLSQLRRSSCRK